MRALKKIVEWLKDFPADPSISREKDKLGLDYPVDFCAKKSKLPALVQVFAFIALVYFGYCAVGLIFPGGGAVTLAAMGGVAVAAGGALIYKLRSLEKWDDEQTRSRNFSDMVQAARDGSLNQLIREKERKIALMKRDLPKSNWWDRGIDKSVIAMEEEAISLVHSARTYAARNPR
jgi:hypothetical protein